MHAVSPFAGTLSEMPVTPKTDLAHIPTSYNQLIFNELIVSSCIYYRHIAKKSSVILAMKCSKCESAHNLIAVSLPDMPRW